MKALEENVRAALGRVFDPCSVAAGAPLSVLDLGLVTHLAVAADGSVAVALRATTPMCTLIACILQGVEGEIRSVPGVSRVDASIDRESPWTEGALSEAGHRVLEARRGRSREEIQVTPQEWKERSRRASHGR